MVTFDWQQQRKGATDNAGVSCLGGLFSALRGWVSGGVCFFASNL